MAAEQYITDSPVRTRADYASYYQEKCVVAKWDNRTWYFGTGIRPAAHPLDHTIPFSYFSCLGCGQRDFAVIAADYVLSPVNGDEFYVFEFVCHACGKYNQVLNKD